MRHSPGDPHRDRGRLPARLVDPVVGGSGGGCRLARPRRLPGPLDRSCKRCARRGERACWRTAGGRAPPGTERSAASRALSNERSSSSHRQASAEAESLWPRRAWLRRLRVKGQARCPRLEPDAVDPISEPRHIRRSSSRHRPTPAPGCRRARLTATPPTRHLSRPVSSRCATACCFPSGRDNVSGGRFRRGWAMVGIRASCARMVT